MAVTGPTFAGAELEARDGLSALRGSPPTLFDVPDDDLPMNVAVSAEPEAR